MARADTGAAGKPVRVDTPEYGCITIDPVIHPVPKAKPADTGAKAMTEGEN